MVTQRDAERFLGAALRVDIGGVNEIDPQLQCAGNNRIHPMLVDFAAKLIGPQPDHGYPDTRSAKLTIIHTHSFWSTGARPAAPVDACDGMQRATIGPLGRRLERQADLEAGTS